MKFKSNAKYGEEAKNGSVFTTKERVVIHHINGCGETWYLTCHELNIEQHNLETENFEDAVFNARIIILKASQELHDKYVKFATDSSNIEIVRCF